MDNTVAVTYISKMGGKIESLNNLTFSIWKFCMNRNIWLSSNHIAGVENTEADYLSRHKNDNLEWMLDRQIFVKIREIYGKCDVDLFASKNNFQFKPYVSYMPDKNASAVDALSINWSDIMYVLHILSFQLDSNGTPENCHPQSGSDNNRPYMADATLVSKATTNDMHGQISTTERSASANDAGQTSSSAPAGENEA